MEIGSEIRQRKFRNEYHKATINLVFTANWMSEQLKGFFEPYDLTPQQFNILRILRGSGAPLSTLQIRERMVDRMSDTSRIVDRLLKKQLVEKKTSQSDKRLVDVTISNKGLDLLAAIDQKQEALDGLVAGLTEEEAASLNKLLDKLRGA
jgi:DNA-binding MarR family transcriptional regulator